MKKEMTDRDRFKAFYLSSPWRKLRLIKLQNDPCCECCLAGCSHYFDNPEGKEVITPAYAVDHVMPLAIDYSLRLDYGNLNSLCARCHSIKTNTTDHYLKRDKQISNNMNDLNDF